MSTAAAESDTTEWGYVALVGIIIALHTLWTERCLEYLTGADVPLWGAFLFQILGPFGSGFNILVEVVRVLS